MTLVGSSILAIIAAVPLTYKSMPASGLRWILAEAWNETPEAGARRIGFTRASQLAWNERVNAIKALVLVAAVAAQIVAIVFLAWGAWEILSVAQLTP